MSNKTKTKANDKAKDKQPRVIITEQPSNKGLRFRYECERKYAAIIVGEHNSECSKTFPTIKILNNKDPVRIVVSCVTKDKPYRPHPNNLTSKISEVARNGICDFEVQRGDIELAFSCLSIQIVKRKDIEKSLALRKKLGIDPFKTGFDHASSPNSIDLYTLRLCFEVFLKGSTPGVYDVPLPPVVSEPIIDSRSKSEPDIVYISHTEGSVAGATEMCILCEGADNDVDALFYREENNWEQKAQIIEPGVIRKLAMVIKTPRYVDQNIKEPVEVKILLYRRSNGDASDAFSFTYLPLASDSDNPLKRKRDEDSDSSSSCERLQGDLERSKDRSYLPKRIDSGDDFTLSAKDSETELDSSGEQEVSKDLPANAYPHSSNPPFAHPHNSNPNGPKNKSSANNIHARNAYETNDRPDSRIFSNTLNSDDWIRELLQTIDEGLIQNNQEPKIIQEPEIRYITPDPVPDMANPFYEPHGNNFMHHNIANNNHQGTTSSLSISDFLERISPLPDQLPSDMSSSNILDAPTPAIPHHHLEHDQPPQYATNINGNQWSNVMSDFTNSCHFPQMSVDNNFNENSGNYMINGYYDTPMQPFNQQNTWNDVQRSTLNEFDPLYSSTQTWHANQQYNGYSNQN